MQFSLLIKKKNNDKIWRPWSAFPRGSHLLELGLLSLLERAHTVLFVKIPAGPSFHLYMN